MSIHTLPYGTDNQGNDVFRYYITNPGGATASVTNLGACLVSLEVPNNQGILTDVVLGFSDAAGYNVNEPSFGATIGRNANRVAGASFELGGKTVKLAANEGKNSLHSGPDSWTSRVWDAEVRENGVTFRLASPDGDQGFPGELRVAVTYTLTDDNTLEIAYEADASAETVVNLTNHSYFNLNGHDAGSVAEHTLWVDAASWLPVAEDAIPTGEVADTFRTPMDFGRAWRLGDGLGSDYPALAAAGGYDHTYCLSPADGRRVVARLAGDASGIVMEVETDLPGLQVYTANKLTPTEGKAGATYDRHGAVCLETQFWPDAVHHADWAQPVFGPERPYRSTTAYRFGVA